MSGLVPWRPLREMEALERRFGDIFDWPAMPALWRHFSGREGGWVPSIEVYEKEGGFVVKAELPGMKEEDIEVSVSDGTLTLKGERKAESEVKEEDYYCCERSYGSFLRSVALPSTVDAEKIGATYEDGVLEVSLPKVAEVKPKKVSVKTRKKDKPAG